MDIGSLAHAYRNGDTTPSRCIRTIYEEIARRGERPVWISLVPFEENQRRAEELEASEQARALPLYGIPFAVKDNFDVAGMDTTAGCPGFAHRASDTATAVQLLLDAGALLIGKTNMDQFATGLVGTRSPYGICTSVFDKDFIAGGSSSGSAVAVAQGLVSFALGTDTAGSGRVPAAFNQLIGLKPTRGRVSTHGLLPACRTLDCVSVFAETCADAQRVLDVIAAPDERDPYTRSPHPGEGSAPWSVSPTFRFGVPTRDSLEFFGDTDAQESYTRSIEAMMGLGGEAIEFDYAPFRKAAALLYQGPWVAERLAAIREFLAAHPDALEPTVGNILGGAARYSAVETFEAMYALQALRRATEHVWNQVDFLLLPTTPTQYRVDEVQAAPVELNSNLGYYTNFVNLLDRAAVAVPAGFKKSGLPCSVSLIGQAFTDEGLLRVADGLHRTLAMTLGGSQRGLAQTEPIDPHRMPARCVALAVVGAHLTGQPLNWQLTQRQSRLISTTRTHGDYRLYALANTAPPKPGLVYAPGSCGAGIEVEIWAMPEDTVGSFLQLIPPPLGLGTIRLQDGSTVKGFICEPSAVDGAVEITQLGGWRNYRASRQEEQLVARH